MEEKIREEERAEVLREVKYFAIQKFLGVILLVLSVVLVCSGFCYDAATGVNDTTFLLITVPIGLYCLFTKKMIFN